MGDVIELDFDKNEPFKRDIEVIVDSFVECLLGHFGQESGLLMARSFASALDLVSEEVLKRLEVSSGDDDFEVEFEPDFKLE